MDLLVQTGFTAPLKSDYSILKEVWNNFSNTYILMYFLLVFKSEYMPLLSPRIYMCIFKSICTVLNNLCAFLIDSLSHRLI